MSYISILAGLDLVLIFCFDFEFPGVLSLLTLIRDSSESNVQRLWTLRDFGRFQSLNALRAWMLWDFVRFETLCALRLYALWDFGRFEFSDDLRLRQLLNFERSGSLDDLKLGKFWNFELFGSLNALCPWALFESSAALNLHPVLVIRCSDFNFNSSDTKSNSSDFRHSSDVLIFLALILHLAHGSALTTWDFAQNADWTQRVDYF